MAKIVVLGAGIGGISQVYELRQTLGKEHQLVLIGDSITHGFEGQGKAVWEQYYQPRHALNLGFKDQAVALIRVGVVINHAVRDIERGAQRIAR